MPLALWIALVATVLIWPISLGAIDNRRHGRLGGRSTAQLLMAGRLCLVRYPEELLWYDTQLAIAGLHRRFIIDENHLSRVEYVAQVS